MSDLKVINLGLPKSGTTTLGEALARAGLKVADWRIRKGQSPNDELARRFVGKLMYEGYFEEGDPLARLPDFNAFTEIDIVRNGLNLWPQTDWGLLQSIKDNHPNAKFILTHRDSASLSDSMGRWSNLGSFRLPNSAIPGMPEGYGGTDQDRIRWIEGHYSFCRRVFAGDPNFLEYDIKDEEPKEKIGKFLGIELPWWGIANENTRRTAEGVD